MDVKTEPASPSGPAFPVSPELPRSSSPESILPIQSVPRILLSSETVFPTKSEPNLLSSLESILPTRSESLPSSPETILTTKLETHHLPPLEQTLLDSSNHDVKMYCIVLFTDEDVVEVVPSSWLVGLNECRWPPISKSWPSFKISKLVRKRKDPEDNFVTYAVQILGLAETYLRACQKREKANFTDDINTSQNDKTSKLKRKITKRRRLYESSDSDENEIPDRNELIGISTSPINGISSIQRESRLPSTSSYQMYCIVLFTEENVVEVVPSSWLVGLNECRLPPISKSWPSFKMSKLVRERMDPEDDFVTYGVQILGSAETYLRACQEREKANFTDDINTSENSKASKQKRKITKRRRLYESSDSDEDEIPYRNELIGISTSQIHGISSVELDPRLPSISIQSAADLVVTRDSTPKSKDPSLPSTSLQSPADPVVTRESTPKSKDPSLPSTSFQTPTDLVVTRESTPRSTDEENMTVRELLCLNAAYNKEILKSLEELKQDIKDLKTYHKQQELWVQAYVNPNEQVNIPVSFPLDNEESLTTLEQFLITPKNKSIMIKKLECIGGLSESDHINRTLRFCLKNNLASKYSFHGRRGSKKSFSSLRLKEVIFEGIKKHRPEITEMSFCSIAGDWLRFAPFRANGHKSKRNADEKIKKIN